MGEITVALAGNPNVGKSTLFNALTGLHQHTGNWPGKTVERAAGTYEDNKGRVSVVDLPGTYSLWSDSPEEEIAEAYLRGGEAQVVVVVADATALRRNLCLALQIRQLVGRAVLCVNLMDEAQKRGLAVDLQRLEQLLHIPVVGTSARNEEGLEPLCRAIRRAAEAPPQLPWELRLDTAVERALHRLMPHVSRHEGLRLLLGGEVPCGAVEEPLRRAQDILREAGLEGEALRQSLADAVLRHAEELYSACVRRTGAERPWQRRLDRLLTGRVTGPAVMLLGLGILFYLTMRGANYPSAVLSRWLLSGQAPLRGLLAGWGAPPWLQGMLADGVYRTTAWVVAVMLPPMAIFFPLFTLLEEMGVLPRVAFNLDRFFRSAGAHGRQSLTMCMALGCSACGVTGCRIIEGRRERLVAMVTNSFVPCNGRLPTLMALTVVFFAPQGGFVTAAAVFVGMMVFAVAMTWLASRLLSATVLKGESEAFSLELPPYRLPRVGKVLVRSLLDRTLLVLGRAVTVSAPAGLVIWCMANVSAGGTTLMQLLAGWLELPGRLMGVDGMILLAFLLAFPANEIVLPALLMGYLSGGELVEYESFAQLGQILTANGWTTLTAVCTAALCLLHFPCGTTCLTIRRESGSGKWTVLAAVLPTVMGAAVCLLLRAAAVLLGGG